MSGHGGGWQEVGHRVYRFRYRSLDLNVGVVLGDDEVLVVDTRSFAAEAAELLADLRALTPLPCRRWSTPTGTTTTATATPPCARRIWGHRRCMSGSAGGGGGGGAQSRGVPRTEAPSACCRCACPFVPLQGR